MNSEDCLKKKNNKTQRSLSWHTVCTKYILKHNNNFDNNYNFLIIRRRAATTLEIALLLPRAFGKIQSFLIVQGYFHL